MFNRSSRPQRAPIENIVYGRKPLADALEAGKRFDKLLIQRELSGEEISRIKSLAAVNGVPIQFVPEEKLDRTAGRPKDGKTANHQGVLGFLSLVEYHTIDDAIHVAHSKGENPLFVMCDGVTDVHNMGAIARSAECLGAHALLLPEGGTAQVNGEAIKASAGALTQIIVCREKNPVTALKLLKAHGLTIFAADMKGAIPASEADFAVPCVIIMGAEGFGISPLVLRYCDTHIAIPMTGKTESLNVSVSAGIILYEAMQQRSREASPKSTDKS
jgi:23S rRNA (guanosine2251-2'-O)-methyltransferase